MNESKGFVLHGRRFRENSRILELFTEAEGRVAVVARVSGKNSGSSLAKYQPFGEAMLRWRGKSSLQSLLSCEAERAFRLDGEAGICGLYCNELLLYLTASGLPYPQLYSDYVDTLEHIATGSFPLANILRQFEWSLLEALGYSINSLSDCLDEAELLGPGPFFFHPEQGISQQQLGARSVELGGQALTCLQTGALMNCSSQRELRAVLGAAIQNLLGNRQLKSKLLVQSLKKYQT